MVVVVVVVESKSVALVAAVFADFPKNIFCTKTSWMSYGGSNS